MILAPSHSSPSFSSLHGRPTPYPKSKKKRKKKETIKEGKVVPEKEPKQ